MLRTYQSFLVRLWCEPSGAPEDRSAAWQSEVEHIQSGQRWRFSSVVALLAFLGRQIEDPSALSSAQRMLSAEERGSPPEPGVEEVWQ